MEQATVRSASRWGVRSILVLIALSLIAILGITSGYFYATRNAARVTSGAGLVTMNDAKGVEANFEKNFQAAYFTHNSSLLQDVTTGAALTVNSHTLQYVNTHPSDPLPSPTDVTYFVSHQSTYPLVFLVREHFVAMNASPEFFMYRVFQKSNANSPWLMAQESAASDAKLQFAMGNDGYAVLPIKNDGLVRNTQNTIVDVLTKGPKAIDQTHAVFGVDDLIVSSYSSASDTVTTAKNLGYNEVFTWSADVTYPAYSFATADHKTFVFAPIAGNLEFMRYGNCFDITQRGMVNQEVDPGKYRVIEARFLNTYGVVVSDNASHYSTIAANGGNTAFHAGGC